MFAIKVYSVQCAHGSVSITFFAPQKWCSFDLFQKKKKRLPNAFLMIRPGLCRSNAVHYQGSVWDEVSANFIHISSNDISYDFKVLLLNACWRGQTMY